MRHYTATSLRSFEGQSPRIGERVLIDPSAVVLGDVELADDVSVWPQASIRGDMHRIRVGERTSVQDGCVLHTDPGIKLVAIGFQGFHVFIIRQQLPFGQGGVLGIQHDVAVKIQHFFHIFQR